MYLYTFSDLTGNDIIAIDETAFIDQSQLLSLTLADNNIANIQSGLLSTLVNLETL